MGRLGKFVFSLLLMIIIGYGALVWFVNREVEKAFNAEIASVDGLELTYADMWVDIGDHTVTISKPVSTLPSGEQLSADEVLISAFDEKHEIPHFIQAEAKGLVINAADARKLGLDVTEDLAGDMVVDYRYNPEAKALTVNSFTFDDAKLGRLAVSGTVTELDLDAFRVEKLIGLHLKDAELVFTDRSYLNNLYAKLAAGAGISEANARKQVAAELQALAEEGERKGKAQAAEEVRHFQAFMEHSGTVTIKAAPVRPVPYLYLFMGRDLYDNFDLLNLSVEAKRPE